MLRRALFTGFVIGLLTIPAAGSAAEFWFEPQESSIGTSNDFFVSVNLTSEEPINAFQGTIAFSPTLEPADVYDGNSIISAWVESPHWDEASRRLTFAGIIPGGFAGKGGRLLTLKISATGQGGGTVAFDPTGTLAYRQADVPTAEPLTFGTLNLPVIVGKDNLPLNLPDTSPPENFTPEIFRSPELFDNRWAAAFATQDKGAGLHHFELSEAASPRIAPARLNWQAVASPVQLPDQTRRQYVLIKAVDKAGNERIVIIPPGKAAALYQRLWFWCILVTSLIILTLGGIMWRRHSRTS